MTIRELMQKYPDQLDEPIFFEIQEGMPAGCMPVEEGITDIDIVGDLPYNRGYIKLSTPDWEQYEAYR